jgi:cobalt-zinc-cadmium efflux system outer membrane protein
VSKLRDINLIPLPPEGGLEKDAESLRPDLKALRLTVTKTNADSDLAHAQVWDNFVVTAGVSRQGSASPNPNDANSVSIPGAYSWNAGLTIPFPVFNRNQGAIQKASTTRDQAERQIQALLLSIHQEVYSDYDQIKLNEGLIRDYEANQLDNARRVRDSQQTLFGTGGSALLDYFDAVSAYQTSLSSYYDVVAEYRRGLARLNAAIGKDVLK